MEEAQTTTSLPSQRRTVRRPDQRTARPFSRYRQPLFERVWPTCGHSRMASRLAFSHSTSFFLCSLDSAHQQSKLTKGQARAMMDEICQRTFSILVATKLEEDLRANASQGPALDLILPQGFAAWTAKWASSPSLTKES